MKNPVAILFANLKGNLGDFAILQAILEDVSLRLPGHPIHVFHHPFTAVNNENLAVFRASAPEFELAGPTYSIRFPFYVKWLTRYRMWKHIQAWYILAMEKKARSDAIRFEQYEAVIVAGGDQWGGSNPGASMFGTVKAISHHNSRIYAYPCSVSAQAFRFNSPMAIREYFAEIRAPIIARDMMTRNNLLTCGVDATFGNDCVFALGHIADKIPPMPHRDLCRVILIVTGSSNRNRLQIVASGLLSAGIPIEFMTTSPPEDAEWFEELARRLGVPVRTPVSWQEAVGELKASSLIVTNRLHAMIFSCFGNTAILPISDRAKAGALAEDMGLIDVAHSIEEISPDRVRKAIANRELTIKIMHAYRAQSQNEMLAPAFDV